MANVLNVNKDNFGKEVLEESKLTIVKFGAAWCGPCKKLDPIIDEIAEENTDIKVTYVDIDTDGPIAAEYGILSVPSTLFFKDGKVMDMIIGLVPKAKIVGIINGMK